MEGQKKKIHPNETFLQSEALTGTGTIWRPLSKLFSHFLSLVPSTHNATTSTDSFIHFPFPLTDDSSVRLLLLFFPPFMCAYVVVFFFFNEWNTCARRQKLAGQELIDEGSSATPRTHAHISLSNWMVEYDEEEGFDFIRVFMCHRDERERETRV